MKIENYEFGKIVVDGKIYTNDLIIFPDKIKPNWWRKEGHSLCIEDIKDVIDYKPEILIIGSGYYEAMKVTKDTTEEIEKLGIKTIIKNSKEATKLFNENIEKNKNVVGAFHLTC